VDDVPIPNRYEAQNAFKDFMAMYDGPAFVRRARQVEGALEDLLQRCELQRAQWLTMVRLRLGTLLALAGDWNVLRPLLTSEEQLRRLEWMHEELAPRLRMPVMATSAPRRLRKALVELCESIELFNRRWHAFVADVDLTAINELRDGYNRYFVLEKECAVRSPRLAREGFVRLEPLTTVDLLARLPPLPLPERARGSQSPPSS
jgi:hypothetical protein